MVNKEKQFKRQNEYIKEHYERFNVALPKGTKERVANFTDVSVTKLMALLLEEYLDKMENK